MRPLGARKHTIYRPGTPSNDDGVYVEGAETEREIAATVATLSGKRRQWINEDFIREQAQMVCLALSKVETSRDGHTGEQIEIKGCRYTFWSENDQDMPGSPLKHYKYYLISSGVAQ